MRFGHIAADRADLIGFRWELHIDLGCERRIIQAADQEACGDRVARWPAGQNEWWRVPDHHLRYVLGEAPRVTGRPT